MSHLAGLANFLSQLVSNKLTFGKLMVKLQEFKPRYPSETNL